MTSHATPSTARPEPPRAGLEHSRQVFLLARAQLAAGRAEPLRREAAMRRWTPHRRRFS